MKGIWFFFFCLRRKLAFTETNIISFDFTSLSEWSVTASPVISAQGENATLKKSGHNFMLWISLDIMEQNFHNECDVYNLFF